jgi:hypothetical protein
VAPAPPPVVESAPPDAAVIPAPPADAGSPPPPVLADSLPDTAPVDDDPDRVVEAYSRADGWETDLVGGPEEKGPGLVGQIGGWQEGGARNYFVRRRVTTRIAGHSRYGPNTPGYRGRLLGAVSVANADGQKSHYGKVHLFPKDTRDFTQATLFGYSFREELGDNAVRHIEVGRAQTTGAYLMVTDLFRDARHSSMGHTVILAFPRDRTNAKGKLYWVDDEPGGRFRLNGPGFWIRFDGPSGELLQASGISIRAQGAIKTPPRVYYPGIQVKIQAVGGNPFLRGRGAMIADARGRECRVSTGDLFDYRGTKGESDMFRFDQDADFFDFVRRRCPGLSVPRVARRQVARSDVPKPEASDSSSGGLFPMLMGR